MAETNDDNSNDETMMTNMPTWSDLPKELLYQHVLSASSLKTIMRFKAVCPSWHAAADEITQEPIFTCLPETPWLVLPGDMNNGHDQALKGCCKLFGIDGIFSNVNTNLPEETRDAICFGASNGWLVLLNHKWEFMLSTPLWNGIHLPLPPLNTFPDVLGIKYQLGNKYGYNIGVSFTMEWRISDYNTEETCRVDITYVKDLEGKLIAKAALSSRPSWSNKENIGVMVMYKFSENRLRQCKNKLAFCTTSDHKWSLLEEEASCKYYKEIMGCDDKFYVLMEDFGVDVWDFDATFSVPVKKMEIRPNASELLAELIPDASELETGVRRVLQAYMIKTAATGLMLVVMHTRDRPDCDKIKVYKLQEGTATPVWERVNSIGDNVLVLGWKNSVVMSHHASLRCDGDAVYYMESGSNAPQCSNLHVFSLIDRSQKTICEMPADFTPLAFSGS